jgi:hypothetical protein
MHVHVVVVELVLVLSQQVQALCIYEKYHQRTLDEKYATVCASRGIQIFAECEQILRLLTFLRNTDSSKG